MSLNQPAIQPAIVSLVKATNRPRAALSLAGFAGATIDPVSFVTEQVPQVPPALVNDNSLVLAWQLGNAYLLLFFIAISLFTSTSEVKVIRHYLYALALGDIGHVGWTCYGIGLERVKDPGSWSVAIWGNIAFTVLDQSL